MLVGRGLQLLLGRSREGLELLDVVEEGVELDVGELGPGEPRPHLGAGALELGDLARLGVDPLRSAVGRHPLGDVGEAELGEVGVARRGVLGDGRGRHVALGEGVDEGVDAGGTGDEVVTSRRDAGVAVAGLLDE